MDKKQISDEMRKILFELELAKFDIKRKAELKKKYEELKIEYRKIVFEETKTNTNLL